MPWSVGKDRLLGRQCLPRSDRQAVCSVQVVEDKQHFVLLLSVQPCQVTAFGPAAALLYFLCLCEANACGGSLQSALHVGSKSCLYEFTELNFLSFGSWLPLSTLNIPI